MRLAAACLTCGKAHLLDQDGGAERYWRHWNLDKHPGHKTQLIVAPADWKGLFGHNADAKVTYVSSATITISLASLASSSTFVAGQESAAQANDGANTFYLNTTVKGKITVGTTPTANTQIRVYALAALDDTPTWPDVFDGTDSAETLTSAGVGEGFLRLAAILNVDSNTTDRAYPFVSRPFSELFGGTPRDWELFVTHNTGVNLNSTAGNHVVKKDEEYFTIA